MRFFLNDLCEIWTRNGVNSVALVHRQKVIGCKLLKGLVPGAGVEPARPFGQRILSPFEGILTDLTKRDEPIFTGRAAVKVMLRPVRSLDRMSSF